MVADSSLQQARESPTSLACKHDAYLATHPSRLDKATNVKLWACSEENSHRAGNTQRLYRAYLLSVTFDCKVYLKQFDSMRIALCDWYKRQRFSIALRLEGKALSRWPNVSQPKMGEQRVVISLYDSEKRYSIVVRGDRNCNYIIIGNFSCRDSHGYCCNICRHWLWLKLVLLINGHAALGGWVER